MPSAEVCKDFRFSRQYNFGKQLYFSKGIAVLFWGRYLKQCTHCSVKAAIKTCTSTCAGRAMSHPMRHPHCHGPVHELSVPTSPCQALRGTGAVWGPGFLLRALTMTGLVTADGCFCESWVTQKQCQLRRQPQECLNKHTCIFLALGAAVNCSAKNMDEFISFQISPLSN